MIPQIGDAERATIGPLLDLKIKTPSGELVPVSTFTRIESSTAPRTLNRFQQRNAVRIFGGVRPRVLVIDDDGAIGLLLRLNLEQYGCDVVVRNDGPTAHQSRPLMVAGRAQPPGRVRRTGVAST